MKITRGLTGSARIAMAFAVCLVGGFGACGGQQPTPTDVPTEHSEFFRGAGPEVTRTSVLFHDEQAFIRQSGREYGDTGKVFVDTMVLAELEWADFDTTVAGQGKRVLIAQVHIRGTAPDGASKPFRKGLNCIYIAVDGIWDSDPANGKLKAELDTSSSGTCPPSPSSPENPSPQLWVDSAQAGDIPPVARWETDTGKHPYFGVKCPLGWCMIGHDSFNAQHGKYHGSYKARIKGWHDEQHLGILPAQGQPAVPSPLVGLLVPIDTLEKIPDSSFVSLQEVGYIRLRRDGGTDPEFASALDFYAEKWGLKNTQLAEGDSVVIKIQRLDTSKDHPNGARFFLYRNEVLVQESDPVALRFAHQPAVQVRHRGGVRQEIPVPGTARWGWSSMDESVWVRCGSGCCEIGSVF
jgi:hypothetical protein